MKPIKTKRQLRDELSQQIQQYLEEGGAVNNVPQGVSGREGAQSPLVSIFDGAGSEDRTPVPEIVAAIEARKKPQPPVRHQKKLRPQKKLILDDFGQPLRWEWVEK